MTPPRQRIVPTAADRGRPGAAPDAGATGLKRAEKAFWRGCSGHFADPDGSLTLPDA